MRPRHAVLLTPSKSSRPSQLLYRQHCAPVSPLAATLMAQPASVANKRLTVGLNPLDATLTKNTGGGSPTFQRGCLTMLAPVIAFRPTPHSLPRIPFLFTLLRTLLRFFALIKNSTLLFSISSALFAKNTRGWGRVTMLFQAETPTHPILASRLSEARVPRNTSSFPHYLLTSLPLCFFQSPVTSLPAVRVLSSPFCRRIAHSSRLGGRHE